VNDLQRKTIEGLTFFIIALAAMLFLPAWSLAYWQAWIYLVLFSAAIILITYYLSKKDPNLLERRLRVGATAEKEKKQKQIQFVAQFAFIAIFVLPAFDHHFHWSTVPAVITIAADVFVLLGFYIVFLTFKENTYTSAIIPVDKKQKVITTGPYALVRHPMYSGSLLMLLATPMALGSWWGLLAFLPMLFVIIWRLRDEEQYLLKQLPGYKEYSQQVRWRLLPYLY
jgi:protein-S-isoprenylcysteine O-methyltransferase Ste14